jgi:hypothetical protein
MNRSSLKFLIVGLLVGGLATSAINASALVTSSSTSPVAAQSAATKKKKKKRKAKKKKKAPAPAAPAAGIPLTGLFRFTPGTFDGGKVGGSYVRLVLAGGSVEKGPFFGNPNSKAGSFTLLSPGSDGGLKTGRYQEAPNPAFSLTGDALANRIMAPQRFAFILYSLSTQAKDPVSGLDVPPPEIAVTPDGKLSGQLKSFTASWNKAWFNQGSPKPDGSSPGLTSPVTGTYDANTKQYQLNWTSQIVGGPFNNFSGIWHLEGTFESTCA